MKSPTQLREEFEDFLKEKHAEDYHGTDDDMPDAYEAWLEGVDYDEIISFADEFSQRNQASLLKEIEEKVEETIKKERFSGAPHALNEVINYLRTLSSNEEKT